MSRLDAPTLIVSDATAFRNWLNTNKDSSGGVWLVLAKKNTTDPTSLTYAQALEEALCQGWIDGQKRSRDAPNDRAALVASGHHVRGLARSRP